MIVFMYSFTLRMAKAKVLGTIVIILTIANIKGL